MPSPARIPFLDLKAQYQTIKAEIDSAVASVIEQAAFILGSELDAFEEEFASYLGVRQVIGVNSGTDALHMALLAAEIGPGDLVVTVANTYVATCEAVRHAGAEVVLVDAVDDTYNIDVNALNDAVTALVSADREPVRLANGRVAHGRVRAIIPVHLYGQPADMDGIMEIAARHRLLVIEDACQAHGASVLTRWWEGALAGDGAKRRRVGGIGHIGCFSFYPGKNLGAYGDAGAVATSDDGLAERLRLLRNHGQKQKYLHLIDGYCHRLDNIQAAVLRVKLRYLDAWNQSRRQRAAEYTELLKSTEGVVLPTARDGADHVYHLFVLQLQHREQVREQLSNAGIETGLHYPVAVPQQPAYRNLGHRVGDFVVSERLAAQCLSLPMFAELTQSQVSTVARAVAEAVS